MDNKFVQWNTAKWWTRTWSPMVGCHKISPACTNCWAEAWAKRFHQSFEPHPTKQKPPRKGVVFCGALTDLWGDWVETPLKPIVDILAYPSKSLDATYIWLTKRVGNMCDTLRDITDSYGLLSNHYFGFTAENQEWFEKRIEKCIDHPYGINMWLSLEPLLGPIDLYPIIRDCSTWPFQWLVVGCESGPNRRPCKIEWVESIVEQCMAAKVPVFVKQLDIKGRCVTDINRFPAHLRIRQVPWAEKGETK